MHTDKTNILRLLKIARGQLDGIINMVEDDRYCIDISTQILASQSILKKVNLKILENHFKHCVKESLSSTNDNTNEEKTSEFIDVLKKILN